MAASDSGCNLRLRLNAIPQAPSCRRSFSRNISEAGGGNSVGGGEKKSAHAAQGLPRPSDDLRCYRRSASLTVSGPPDEKFKGRANSCRSGSGPFGACALPDVFELWWPSVFTSVSAFNEVLDTGKAPQSIHWNARSVKLMYVRNLPNTIKLSFKS
jgi:hypothetical protein